MKLTAVNPWSWSVRFGFDQARLVEGHRRELVCSGQTAVDAEGQPQHPDDMAAQMSLASDNLEAVLAEAGMTLANVVRLNVYTTDVDALLQHFSMFTDRFGDANGRLASTLLGVTRPGCAPTPGRAGGDRGGLSRLARPPTECAASGGFRPAGPR